MVGSLPGECLDFAGCIARQRLKSDEVIINLKRGFPQRKLSGLNSQIHTKKGLSEGIMQLAYEAEAFRGSCQLFCLGGGVFQLGICLLQVRKQALILLSSLFSPGYQMRETAHQPVGSTTGKPHG